MKAYKTSTFLNPIRYVHLRAHSFLEKFLKEELNPLANTGAIANISFIIAIATGVMLLFWYSPSVFVAYDSVVDMMTNKNWYAGIIRSVHRYSSDACVFFMILHIVEVLSLEKIERQRWPAWVTGIFLFFVIWFEGWIGYWLVWDEGAKYIAINTARLMDVVPVFAEPLSRSFLTKDSINSLFFFVVFFGHMLIPLGIAILIWIHVTRISKPKLFTKKPLTIYIVLSLVFLSVFLPAQYGPAADMQSLDNRYTLDLFYSLPLMIIQYVSPFFSWLLFLITILIASTIPFIQKFKKEDATSVDHEKCHACRACYNDCPFNAIEMIEVSKTEGGRAIQKAEIDKNLCLQCGICVGSCSTDAIQYPALQKIQVEEKIRSWIKNEKGKFQLTFVCKDTFLKIDKLNASTGEWEGLPGHRVIEIPNAAWLNMMTIEELVVIDKVEKINILSGGSGSSSSRFGHQIGFDRIVGNRYPKLSIDEKYKGKLTFYNLYEHEWNGVFENLKNNKLKYNKPIIKYALAVVVTILIGTLISKGSNVSLTHQNLDLRGRLIVSFKQPGAFKDQKPDDAHLNDNKLKHMKRKNSPKRERENVSLQINIDGKNAIEKKYGPSGVFGDGSSLGTEEIIVEEGVHFVEVIIKDSEKNDGIVFKDVKEVNFSKSRNVVVLYDKGKGFRWY